MAERMWPHVVRALRWLDHEGDRDGDGFVEYEQRTPKGLVAQGWKDSNDAISHADGSLAAGPIALCEVQGYAFAARLAGAELARALGYDDDAHRLEVAADRLRRHFERVFWSERLNCYALALDRDKRPCEVIASNAGHLLWSGIASPGRAARVARTLLADGSFTAWGVRTLDASAARFNPISYHNGSVWPHDNAFAALGLAQAGDHAGVVKVLEGLFDASVQFNSASLPELFCGFRREAGLGPVPYPVACYPQAWSAASIFMILQAMLGMRVNGFERRVVFGTHLIPSWLDWMSIDGLKVGDGRISFVLRRSQSGAAIEVKEKSAGLRVEL
jgi:glycogen debranching enzyme